MGSGVRAFMNAASPGLMTAFQPNKFYPSHEAYLADLVEAMRPEYEAIVAAGFELQLDCPDLAMSRHTGYQDLSEPSSCAWSRPMWRRSTPPRRTSRPIACACTSAGATTRGRTITTSRSRKFRDRAQGAAATILFEAANPRHEHEWIVWRDAAIPDDKMLAPG